MRPRHQLVPDHLEHAPRPGSREIFYPLAAMGHQQRACRETAQKEGGL